MNKEGYQLSSGLNIQDDPDARAYIYSDSTLLMRMVNYLLAYRKHFLAVVIFTIAGIIVSIIQPFVIRQAIDVDFVSGDIAALLNTAIYYVVLQIIAWLVAYGSEYTVSSMGQQAVYDIRQDLYQHLQDMSQDFYDKSSSGRIISRITNDIDRMSELLSGGLIDAFAQAFIVIAIGYTIFTVDVQLSLVSLSVIPILLISTIYFRRKLREAYRSTRKTISGVTSNFAETISGAKVTKSFAREDVSVEIFDEINKADYRANIDAGKAQSTFFPTIRFIGAAGIFLILLFGGFRLIEGTVTLGTVVLFIQFSQMFFRPILIISNFYTSVQSAFAGAERVFSVLDEMPTIMDSPTAIEMPEIQGRITFDNVTFGYVEGKPVLEHFNLEIKPGESIALVGDTGAGKTTVVSLLNRFYDVQRDVFVKYNGRTYDIIANSVVIEGEEYTVEDDHVMIDGEKLKVHPRGAIKIDDIDIRSVTQESLRASIGLVLQDPFLFMGTVRENIRYGRPGASDEEMLKAIDAIGARRVLESLENGFDTEVGERGSNLSEGERQLVSFARALLANPKILVLDEATSSIDIYTEYAIQKGMKALLKDRTSIVIAHRLSTIVNADRILVLEDGKIVESGRHGELMAKKGKYYSLYELQIKPRAMHQSATAQEK